MAAKVACTHCGQLVDPDAPNTHYLVRGWAVRRSGGGANQIAMPQELGQYAHRTCFAEMRRGVKKGQGGLF